jgi:hypothetical protein
MQPFTREEVDIVMQALDWYASGCPCGEDDGIARETRTAVSSLLEKLENHANTRKG